MSSLPFEREYKEKNYWQMKFWLEILILRKVPEYWFPKYPWRKISLFCIIKISRKYSNCRAFRCIELKRPWGGLSWIHFCWSRFFILFLFKNFLSNIRKETFHTNEHHKPLKANSVSETLLKRIVLMSRTLEAHFTIQE